MLIYGRATTKIFHARCQRIIKSISIITLKSVLVGTTCTNGVLLFSLFICVRGLSQNYISLIYIKLYTIQVSSCVARWGTGGPSSPQPEKFAKDGEQPAPQPVVSLDSNGKFKFVLIF